jgi:hypothetical protein
MQKVPQSARCSSCGSPLLAGGSTHDPNLVGGQPQGGPSPCTPVVDPELRLHVRSSLDCWVRGIVAEETVASVALMRETAGTGNGCRAPLAPPPPKKGVVVSSGSMTMSWSRLWFMDWVREIVRNAEAMVVSERETTGKGRPPPPRGGHSEQRLRNVAQVLLLMHHLGLPDH